MGFLWRRVGRREKKMKGRKRGEREEKRARGRKRKRRGKIKRE